MAVDQEPIPDHLMVVINLLAYAFQRTLAEKRVKTSNKGLELISNVSTTTTDVNNYGDANNE